jgi:hypothetical protein
VTASKSNACEVIGVRSIDTCDVAAQEREALVYELLREAHEDVARQRWRDSRWTGEAWGRVIRFPTVLNRPAESPFRRVR